MEVVIIIFAYITLRAKHRGTAKLTDMDVGTSRFSHVSVENRIMKPCMSLLSSFCSVRLEKPLSVLPCSGFTFVLG